MQDIVSSKTGVMLTITWFNLVLQVGHIDFGLPPASVNPAEAFTLSLHFFIGPFLVGVMILFENTTLSQQILGPMSLVAAAVMAMVMRHQLLLPGEGRSFSNVWVCFFVGVV